MTNEENNETTKRPNLLSDLLNNRDEVSVRYIPHVNTESEPDVAPVDTSSDRDFSTTADPHKVGPEGESQQSWTKGEQVRSFTPSPDPTPSQTKKVLRPGSSNVEDNPGSTTQW